MPHRLVLSFALLVTACQNQKTPIDPGRYVIQPTGEQADPLATFESMDELRALVKLAQVRARGFGDGISDDDAESAPAAEPTDSKSADANGGDEGITNNQVAGVDEGGIVKAHGDYLVVLRRGRLFTVKLGDQARRAVSRIDVTPPGGGHDAWYDEMLIRGDQIVVVGYSYQKSATELGFFKIADDGKLSYRKTYYLRSNDYYSSRNYASRLIGDKLIFYMPFSLVSYGDAAMALPGVRDGSDQRRDHWEVIVTAERIFRPIQAASWPVLHTVVTCDLARGDIGCEATGIVGPWGRNFYVSRDAVYVWVTGEHAATDDSARSVVYRMPLDGSAPGALRVRGAPVDQFSFDERDGFLRVLVRDQGTGDWMWNPETTSGGVALMAAPVAAFANAVAEVRADAYATLPAPARGYTFHNRFVGDHVLYGTGSGWYGAEPRDDRVFIHSIAAGKTSSLELVHGVDRIEALGANAVVVGTDGKDLHFSSIALGRLPRLASRYTQKNAAQGEQRSHGFFYKPTGSGGGILGLPVMHSGAPGYAHLTGGSASVLFLSVDGLRLAPVGQLAARSERARDDQCKVSCVDWYGNARPIFYRGRIFALLGYELVEGRLAGQHIAELGRVDFLQPNLAIAR
jgi:hypothetical protein